ncbi:putative zinc finger protein [Annulohypoxylon moriforme]|nr:putative zinc finger protein [Annulohypoxylon moriforme]
MDCHSGQCPFERTLEEFRKDLEGRDVKNFEKTTLEVLESSIITLQTRQHEQRQLRNFNRLQPFLEAIKQYGEVVKEFCSNNDIITFFWGPLKLLLETTSISTDAFSGLLGAYENIGESLPLLVQYQDTFRIKPHLIRILSDIYADIFEFQRILLRYFQNLEWQQVFAESWDICKSRFPSIVIQIARRRSLIENEASLFQIEEARKEIQQSRKNTDDQFNEQNLHRLHHVYNWLKAFNVQNDQDDFSKVRAKYPGTGRWLLENTVFKEWFHPQYATIPPLLWLNGILGAGKTVLTSLVVEEARKLNPAPTVLFFYFKHGSSGRDSFVALGRSLLRQFLEQDNGLLPTLYQKSCRSGDATLTSPALVEELLHLALANCKSAYIILDGLDECPREQRKYITQWFKKLVEDLPNSKPDRLRCLFVSQDDGPARKDFDGISSIKIDSKDNKSDIEEYCRTEANKLREGFSLNIERTSVIASTVANSVQGIFLLAKLIWENLSGQASVAALDRELEPNVFPETINDAYSRIMERIRQHTPQATMNDTLRLLGWLVCAKRPLKWHEIQGMKSINLEEQCVDFDRQGFVKSPKDLCASLLETRSDGTVELIHLTAKFFLIDKDIGYINPAAEELKIASFCIDYLNLPAFASQPTEEGVLNGDYGFMDYAVLYWLRHLETAVTLQTDDQVDLMQQLAESLEIFIEKHWASPRTTLTLAKRHSDKLDFFKAYPFHERLEQIVASTRRQLKDFGRMKKQEIALDFVDVVREVRRVLEQAAFSTDQETIREKYGKNLFKCPRFSCHFFTAGYRSVDERDKHIEKHERPFQCPEEGCPSSTLGCSSLSEWEKHMEKYHFTAAVHDEEFPTEQDIEHSTIRSHAVVSQNQNESMGDSTTSAIAESESESVSEAEPQYLAPRKRQRQTEFKCPHCPKVFKKRYNLNSHLDCHGSKYSYTCQVQDCGQQFTRLSDLTRHKSIHTGENRSVCQVCRKSFARADILKKHYESRVGQACFQHLQQHQ